MKLIKNTALFLAMILLFSSVTVFADPVTDSSGQTRSSENSGTAEPDQRTKELDEMYSAYFDNSMQAFTASGYDYEEELARFPADYQALISDLHEKHPNWIFVAYPVGLDWDAVVAGESVGSRSLLRSYNSTLLLSKDSADYNAATGAYIPKDGTTSVNANDAAIAHFLDPRNYLNEKSVFAMELLSFDERSHTLDAVEAILDGTDLSNKKISYMNVDGNIVNLETSYGEAIVCAGVENGISPLMLASRIRQETGGRLTNGSISGNFSYNGVSYRGYYNFYNIGATATATGSAVANGLTYAKGGSSNGRPWTSPLLAISGGAKFLASNYIAAGQDTNYFQKFDVKDAPYYTHQYMQTIYAIMNESASTYNAYKNYNLIDNPLVFSVPVYQNMPQRSGKFLLSKSVSTAKATTGVTLRTGPGTSNSAIVTIPKGATVTVSGGVFTDSASVQNQLNYPFWLKIDYNGKSGYCVATYFQMDSSVSVGVGETTGLTVASNPGGKVSYQTQDPAIATVNSNGTVKGVANGECTIYAFSSSGHMMDAIGVTVGGESAPTPPPAEVTYATYKLTADGVNYRTEPGTSGPKAGKLNKGTEIQVEDGYSQDANGYTWVRFTYNGGTYYIASNYIEKVAEQVPETPATYTAYKTTTKVNYRNGVGTSAGKVGSLAKDTEIQVEDGFSQDANGYTWVRFTYNGGTYYIASNYVTKVEVAVPPTETPAPETPAVTYSPYKTTTKVNYRSGVGTSASKVGSLAKGTEIQVEDGFFQDANGYTWVRFTYKGGTYYIASNYVTKAGTSAPAPEQPPAATYSPYKTTTKVNYRSGVGTSSGKVGSLAKGTEIQVEDGFSQAANGYTWYRFTYNGGTYYIASNYVTKIGNAPAETPAPEQPSTGSYSKYKTTTGVNYRNGVGTSAAKKGSLPRGTVIEVENGFSQDANGYTWYRFRYNGGTYYIASKYITSVDGSGGNTPGSATYTKYKTTTGVNYRSGAGTSYSKKGTLSRGTTIEVEDGYSQSSGGYTWVRFKYKGGTYYIASKYLTR